MHCFLFPLCRCIHIIKKLKALQASQEFTSTNAPIKGMKRKRTRRLKDGGVTTAATGGNAPNLSINHFMQHALSDTIIPSTLLHVIPVSEFTRLPIQGSLLLVNINGNMTATVPTLIISDLPDFTQLESQPLRTTMKYYPLNGC